MKPDVSLRSGYQAIILAAGNGDRFAGTPTQSKLTTLVDGTPLLARTLVSAYEAGISDAHVVLGFDATRVRATAAGRRPAGMRVYFHVNKDWHRENGISVLAARGQLIAGPFAVLMGDHLFEPKVLQRLLSASRQPGETLLGIDRHTTNPAIVNEATKVRLTGDRISAIGKDVRPYDGLDTGLFVCDSAIFDALESSCTAGDTTLSAGVSLLASRGLARGVDVGVARWFDIDTVDDLAMAESSIADQPVP